MKKLQKIMKIDDYDERIKQLVAYAKDLGVSITYIVGKKEDGKTDENILWEKINQAISIKQAQNSWMISLAACGASIISAIAAWAAILR